MELKTKFRDEFKQWVKETLGTDLDRLPTIRQSKAMIRFYLETIQRVITPGLVPSDEEDLNTCIIDGADDCGVDFLCRADGAVLVMQAKYRGYARPEKHDEFTHFCEVLKRLHPTAGASYKKSEKLREAISDIDWDNDFFILQFITLGRAGENIRARGEAGPLCDHPLEYLTDRCDLMISDENDLNVSLREALSTGEMISQPVRLRFVPDEQGAPWLKLPSSKRRSLYCGFMSGSEIAELYRPHRFKLFAMNIRDWVGDTSTNKGIVATATESPDNFLFFNNGVSAVATSIEELTESNTLVCRNFSIINGAQTVRSLYKAQSRKPANVKEVQVSVRISTFSLGKEPEFLEDVTKYNNTQNKVAVSDFRSNDPVQRDLAEKFAQVKCAGRSFWYKNKRSREKRDRIPIEMEEFAKTIHSFKYGPHDMYGGTARLFDLGSEGRYCHVFGDGESIWSKVPEEDFRLLAGIWFLCQEVRRFWNDEKEQRPKDAVTGLALERRYMVYFGVGELLRLIYEQKGKDLNAHIQQLANPKWTERDSPERTRIKELAELAFTGLVKAYETAQQSKDFRHRNWFRDKDYLTRIRSELRFIRDIKATGKDALSLLKAE